MQGETINTNEQQSQIKDWFNQTYQKRAFQYLRPVEAYEIYLSLLKVEKETSILDIACGPGQMLKAAQKQNLNLSGIDISDVAIDFAKTALPQANLQVANAEDLPYSNNQFDYLTCLGSLERFMHLEVALKEMLRVAKTTARFCFLVRNSERASWKIIKDKLGIINKAGHQGAKTLNDWSAIFIKTGFKIERIHHDQWPKTRWSRWLSLNSKLWKVDYQKIQPRKTALESAYEFIFILSFTIPYLNLKRAKSKSYIRSIKNYNLKKAQTIKILQTFLIGLLKTSN